MMLGQVVVRADGILALENLASLEAGLHHRAPGPAHRHHHMIVGQVVVVLGALLVNRASLVRMVDGGAHLANLARANQVKVAEEGGLLVHHHGAHPANRASLVMVEDLVGAHPANLESQAVEEDGLVHHHHGAHPANRASLVMVEDGTAGEIQNLANPRAENPRVENPSRPRDSGSGNLLHLQSLILHPSQHRSQHANQHRSQQRSQHTNQHRNLLHQRQSQRRNLLHHLSLYRNPR
mmetsp:Transcript_10306/g.17465  ORF Transcript_10306/g.17465 Transcript_10306/m.17465 type:complete len:237 (+) Transcript_10306:503-1213(+)